MRAAPHARLARDVTAAAPRSIRLFVPRPLVDRAGAEGPSDPFPALKRALSRARSRRYSKTGLRTLLLASFGVARQRDWPIAALSWLGEGREKDATFRLRADPVHLRADRDALVLVDPRQFPLAEDEAAQLVDALNAHFEPDGLHFDAPAPTRWYVTTARAPDITTQPLELAAGRSVDPLLPSGPEAMTWHRYFNEIQMLFHAHPVNAVREQAGLPAVNSTWFWGGGVLPSEAAATVSAIWADDPVARGLASIAQVQQHGAPTALSAWSSQASAGEHLIWLDVGGLGLDSLEHRWFAPLLEALRTRAIARAFIAAGDADETMTFELTPADLWKFWRRAPQSILS